MTYTYPSVLDFGLAAASEVLTRGFTNYFVPIQSSPAMLAGMARADSVDLAVSRIVVRDGSPVGAALIARRGWTCRLAGMAIVPEARQQGVGKAIMAQLLEEARARGERTMVLEVIEQNAPAVRLYEGCGFTKVRRLVGHGGKVAVSAAATLATLDEIDPRELAALVSAHGLRDLPWQLSAETLAQSSPPQVAYRLGPSAVLLTNPAADQVVIRALLTENSARGRGHSLALLRAVMARYPGKEWRAAAIYPEEMSAAFTDAGLVRTPISQWQMTRPL